MHCAQEQIQPDYELIGDGNFELSDDSYPSQFSGLQRQPWNPGSCPELLRQDNIGPTRLSNTAVLSDLGPPCSPSYAAERCMKFPQYGSLEPASGSEFPVYQPSYQTSVPKENRDCRVANAPLVCKCSFFYLVFF